MRYLILSDIHANWEALQATVADAKGQYDKVLCLGDLVGYGADPNLVTEWVREHAEVTVRGNHDKACTGDSVIEWFNPAAQASAIWTMDALTRPNMEYLLYLPRGPLTVELFQLVHGSPLDEDEYIIETGDAEEVVQSVGHQVTFFGHTHVQGGFAVLRGDAVRLPQPPPEQHEIVLELDESETYLINPGSVGQPRDQDWRAAYVIYDPEQRLVRYRRVVYDVGSARRKILSTGAPQILADRLRMGM